MHVAILGSGISGLTAAYVLRQQGHRVELFEKQDRAGGLIQTSSEAGFLIEHGPATIRASTPLIEEMIEELGLEVVEASPRAKRRYVVRDGDPVALPSSPLDLLTTPLFSVRGKLRLLGEPFIPARSDSKPESVAAFVRRRFGREAVTYGADPFLAGIFAGNPEALSIHHALPSLPEIEQENGSLLRGMMRRKKNRSEHEPRHKIFSFRGGLEELPQALAERLGDALHLGTEITGLSCENDGWRLDLRQNGQATTRRADAVVSTLPLTAWSKLGGIFEEHNRALAGVTYPPVGTLTLGFRSEDIAHSLDGFGVLIPSVETDFSMLGVIFTSSIFPEQSPSGHVLLSVRLGGERRPEIAAMNLMDIRRRALDDLDRLIGLSGEPVLTHYWLARHAIPQYTLGYDEVLHRLEEIEREYPQLAFAGNYRRGIAVPDAMESGTDAARRITGSR